MVFKLFQTYALQLGYTYLFIVVFQHPFSKNSDENKTVTLFS